MLKLHWGKTKVKVRLNFDHLRFINLGKILEKKQQQKTRNLQKAVSHLRRLSHTSSYLY